MVEHPLDVFLHVTRAHPQHFAFAGGQGVGGHRPVFQRIDPLLQGAALVLADVFEHVQGVARGQQGLPVAKAAAAAQHVLLQIAQLAGQQPAQVQVAVHHVVDDAQHQVGRAGRQAGRAASLRAMAVGQSGEVVFFDQIRVHAQVRLLVVVRWTLDVVERRGPTLASHRAPRSPLPQLTQAGLEKIPYRAIGRVHRQQHAVEHRKAHRAGVDGGQGLAGAGGRAALLVQEHPLGALTCGQPAEHQQVVPRGVVVLRGQLRVDQVGDVQIDQAPAGQPVQVFLRPLKLHLEDATAAGHPQETLRRQGGGPVRQFGEAVVDQEKAHGNPWVTSSAS